MPSYDECLRQMPQGVQNAIERVVLNAGTSDADFDILEAAGREIVRLENENDFLRTHLDVSWDQSE